MEDTTPQQSSQPQTPSAHTNETLMGILAYLGILIIIPFLMAKDDPFVKFHIRQGLVLLIIDIVVWFLGGMLFWHLWPLLQLINLAVLVLVIIGIVNVINHKETELPLVGSWAKSFNI